MPPRLAAAAAAVPAVLVAALVALAACGDSADTASVAPSTTSTTAPGSATVAPTSVAPTPTSSPSAFPVTVTAGNGSVTIPAAPQRIVSLSASLTEMLYAVGAGDQVAAVDKYSNFPAGAPVNDLSGFKPNVESIAALSPDLVVVSGDREGIVAALDAVGIPVLLLPPATTIDDTYAQLATLGASTGHVDGATATTSTMREELATIAAAAAHRAEPLAYYYELADDGNTVTSETFIGNVLALAGLTSIADAAPDAAGGYPQLNAEAILAADPAVVFLAHSDGENPTAEELGGRPGWTELRAVREGHVVELDPDIASRWGPRIVDLLRTVVDTTAGIP